MTSIGRAEEKVFGLVWNLMKFIAVGGFIMTCLYLYSLRSDDIVRETQRIHEGIIATTHDVSNGADLVRIRHQPLVSEGGRCSLTVQRYSRKNTRIPYTEPPEYIMLDCTK
ncbi:MAG: hypothetical protein NUW00_05245 [Candidatus Kaiserbacteria bacterium]|nr:hypothetical protein [Candidatus Kaiserbacteria bacterium]